MNWLARRVRRYLRLLTVGLRRYPYSHETWMLIRENRRISASLKRNLRKEGYL